ncbi:hypothetical protein TcCL_ESM01606, partial [Trypanosoma cruzi]
PLVKRVAGIQIEVGGGCRGMHWKAALHHTSFFAWTSGGLADCPTAWAQLRAGGGGSALSEAGTRLTTSDQKCLCGGRGRLDKTPARHVWEMLRVRVKTGWRVAASPMRPRVCVGCFVRGHTVRDG